MLKILSLFGFLISAAALLELSKVYQSPSVLGVFGLRRAVQEIDPPDDRPPTHKTEIKVHIGANTCNDYNVPTTAEFFLKTDKNLFHPRLHMEMPGVPDLDAGARIGVYDRGDNTSSRNLARYCRELEFSMFPAAQSVADAGVGTNYPNSLIDLNGFVGPTNVGFQSGYGFIVPTGGDGDPGSALSGALEIKLGNWPDSKDYVVQEYEVLLSYNFVHRATAQIAIPQKSGIINVTPVPARTEVQRGSTLLEFVFPSSTTQYKSSTINLQIDYPDNQKAFQSRLAEEKKSYQEKKENAEGLRNLLFFVFSTVGIAFLGVIFRS